MNLLEFFDKHGLVLYGLALILDVIFVVLAVINNLVWGVIIFSVLFGLTINPFITNIVKWRQKVAA